MLKTLAKDVVADDAGVAQVMNSKLSEIEEEDCSPNRFSSLSKGNTQHVLAVAAPVLENVKLVCETEKQSMRTSDVLSQPEKSFAKKKGKRQIVKRRTHSLDDGMHPIYDEANADILLDQSETSAERVNRAERNRIKF